MENLFIFGIGGSGARVIKALTMLLATGVKTNYNIIPIMIDPDRSNGDLSRTLKLLENYQFLQKAVNGDSNCGFFQNKLEGLSEIARTKGQVLAPGFNFFNGSSGIKFKDFIEVSTLSENNKTLTEALFSEANLEMDMEFGYQGNPNIGSVVLNSFINSPIITNFAQNFGQNDRIFIVSSIFGGTGASGFPLLLKTLRNGFIQGQNFQFLKDATIGALTMMPYFKLDNKNSAIDSNSFITKTQAALHYYERNITGDVNAMYYIGDDANGNGNLYENQTGGSNQKNNAHFIEMASALAIVDFANTPSEMLTVPKYKEFGIEKDTSNIKLTDLSLKTQNLINKNITQYFYFEFYFKNQLSKDSTLPYAKKFDSNFLNGTWNTILKSFNDEFRIWLAEMAENNVSFKPFAIDILKNAQNQVVDYKISQKEIFKLVEGIPEKSTGFLGFGAKNIELFQSQLNESVKSIHNSSQEKALLELFFKATGELIGKKLF